MSSRAPRSRRPVPSVEPPEEDDDPFGLGDELGGGVELELAVDVPGPASSPQPQRPRAAATAGPPSSRVGGARPAATTGAPTSRRDIQVTRRAEGPPSPLRPAVDMILLGLLLAGIYLARPHLAPETLGDHLRQHGGATVAGAYTAGSAACLVATLAVAAAGFRRLAFSLLLSALGLLALTMGAVAALGVLAAPGLLPPIAIKIGVLVGPWGGVVAALGIALFALTKGRDLHEDPDIGWLAFPSYGGLVIAVGAAGWMTVSGPHLSLDDASEAVHAAEPAVAQQAGRFETAVVGAWAVDAAHDGVDVSSDLRAAARAAAPRSTTATPTP